MGTVPRSRRPHVYSVSEREEEMIPRLGTAKTDRGELDGVEWKGGFAFASQGRRIGVRVSAAGHADRIRELLPPGSRPLTSPDVRRLYSLVAARPTRRKGPRACHLVYAQSDRIARTSDLERALLLLESDLQLYVAEHSRSLVFVHAGVVGWRGRAIVIPGRSYSGKSTLVAALVKAGARYYSDEFAPIDARGRVHPYLVPLRLRQGAGEAPKRVVLTAPGSALRPIPVGLIVATRYERGARWRHRTVTPGRAALEVLKHVVPARRTPGRVMERLAKLTSRAPLVKGRRGRAAEAARRILELADRLAEG